MENFLFEQRSSAQVVRLEFVELGAAEEDLDAPDAAGRAIVDDAGWKAELEEVWATRMQSACEDAADEARQSAESHYREALEVERSGIAVACASFAKAREKYFASVEGEVVRLSLAIAARVLQRESKMDPLLLTGVVRVAMSKLNDVESAALHVPVTDAELWRRAMKSTGMRVEGDSKLREGEVQLRSNAGVAELGIEAQLQEVERGFFDLLAKRPA